MQLVRTHRKGVVYLLSFLFLNSIFIPTSLFATTGPTSPEFSDFESVGTSNMVNPFTGDFTYNVPVIEIPGPNGSSYAMSLSYHSGANITQDPSWVGYGWTLNPGAITRNTKGFPDDFAGEEVTYYNKTKPNYTIQLQPKYNFEIMSSDISGGKSILKTLFKNQKLIYRYNSYKGHSILLPKMSLGGSFKVAKETINTDLSYSDGVVNADLGHKYLNMNVNSESGFSATIGVSTILNDGMKGMQGNISSKNSYKAIKYLSRLANTYTNRGLNKALSGHLNFKSPYLSKHVGFSGSFNPSVQVNGTILNSGFELGVNGNISYMNNKKVEPKNVYGYLYSGNLDLENTKDADPDKAVQDYHLEHQSAYNRRTKYLHIPFSNADNFIVSGEGVTGSFRAYSRKAGYFRPNKVSSHAANVELSPEVGVGSHLSLGGTAGAGYHNFVQNDWGAAALDAYKFTPFESPYTTNIDSTDAESFFFRFANDQGGDVHNSNNDAAQAATIGKGTRSGIAVIPSKKPRMPDGIFPDINDQQPSGRANYIGYNTGEERWMSRGAVFYNMFSQHNNVTKHLNPIGLEKGISEFQVNDASGRNFVYGLPVYARNEADLSYGLFKFGEDVTVENNHKAYLSTSGVTPESAKWVTGEVKKSPYASQYLLTEITTPDYVDITKDGPTKDDLGGWVRFDYDQMYGSDDSESKQADGNWFRWRIPYTGLKFEKNEVSNPEDDRGYVSRGEKEVYYLETVETKTHKAVFKTSLRTDALEAFPNEDAFEKNPTTARKSLKRLDHIKLYAKTTTGETLIKTVHFSYNYSLCMGIPNHATGGGVLTLKKMWTEYEDVQNAEIYPYVFNYKYPGTDYPKEYNHLEVDTTALTENPSYSAFLLDRWGAYQPNGAIRHSDLRTWLDQTERGVDPTITTTDQKATFDPAAWQLKQIILPTQGEIHVQYEQDQYLHVQDREAMAMVRLKSIDDSFDEPRYYLDANTDLGINNTGDLTNLRNLLRQQFLEAGPNQDAEKIYFKFLYALFGNTPDINTCGSDFIDGYASIASVEIDANGLFLTLKRNKNLPYNFLPKQVCKEHVEKSKFGELLLRKKCNDPYYNELNDDLEESENGVGNLITEELGRADRILEGLKDYVNNRIQYCKDVDETHSYFRIPVLNAKNGGGLRVKRLLTYDKGLERGDQVLYGKEYVYETVDGACSGVATTEPSKGREENALVRFMELRQEEKYANKIVAGTDKQQFEGPLGESLLPAPSVGYSTVFVNDIHSGKTSTGYTRHQYWTYKDFPFNTEFNDQLGYRPIEKTAIQHKQFYLPIYVMVASAFTDLRWLSQGYRFIRYDIHGQPKKIANFAKISSKTPSSYTKYNYFKPHDAIEVWDEFNEPVPNHYPGKEMEIIQETRKQNEYKASGQVEVDAGMSTTLPPVATASATGSGSFSHDMLAMHVTNKLISYPPIVRSVTQMQDGIVHTTENKAFDYKTGNPVWVTTTDEYHEGSSPNSSYKNSEGKHQGAYSSLDFPAHWEKPEMGAKYESERLILHSAELSEMSLNTTTDELVLKSDNDGLDCDKIGTLYPGSLIVLMGHNASNDNIKRYYYIEAKTENGFLLKKTSWETSSKTLATVDHLVVLKSGVTNQLSTTIANIKTYSGDLETSLVDKMPTADRLNREDLANQLNAAKGTIIPTSSLVTVQVDQAGSCVNLTSFVGSIGLTYILPNGQDVSDTLINISVGSCGPLQVPKDGIFKINKYGSLEYWAAAACGPIPVQCLDLCPKYYPKLAIENVLDVGVTDFAEASNLPASIINQYDANDIGLSLSRAAFPHEFGALGKWHPTANYAYRTTIKGLDSDTTLIQDGTAVFDDFKLFDWEHPSTNDATKWLRMDTTELYSPEGHPMQVKNILDIPSISKIGYQKNLPYLLAQNSTYKNAHFESFENNYSSGSLEFEDGYIVSGIYGGHDPLIGHAGNSSFDLMMNPVVCPTDFTSGACHEGELPIAALSFDQQLVDNGLTVQVWVKTDDYTDPKLRLAWNSYEKSFDKIARTGEWVLYRVDINDWKFIPTIGSSLQATIKVVTEQNTSVHLDDVIAYPFDAQVNAYVYDVNNYKLLTVFDNHHFGAYFQYNHEGKLIRKQKETTKGFRTLTESHYHLPGQGR